MTDTPHHEPDEMDLRQYLPEYASGQLSPALAEQVQAWLAQSPQAQRELVSLRALLTLDRSLDGPAPVGLQQAFYTELGRMTATSLPAAKPQRHWLSWLRPGLAWALAAGLALLSFGLGDWLAQRRTSNHANSAELAALQSEVQSLRLALMQAQLDSPETESRLRGVRYGAVNLRADGVLLERLSAVIAGDANDHVRLSAAQVLLDHAEQPRYAQHYVELCIAQDSATVQLVMLGMLGEVDPARARQLSRALMARGHLSPQHTQLVQRLI
ncbi:MAG: hypothetical protein KDI51_18355 [Xanthomonadales bacterium]|nr:hypothetical protein [Xanthomonadales bacterium]